MSVRAGSAAGDGASRNYSVQSDHLHYVVEARDREALTSGMRGLHVRLSRAINRVLGRCGKVFAESFHVHVLRTPIEVRNAVRYVLGNACKHGHGRRPGVPAIDPASSGRWFAFWATGPVRCNDRPAVARARHRWLTHGLLRIAPIDPLEVPGAWSDVGPTPAPRRRGSRGGR